MGEQNITSVFLRNCARFPRLVFLFSIFIPSLSARHLAIPRHPTPPHNEKRQRAADVCLCGAICILALAFIPPGRTFYHSAARFKGSLQRVAHNTAPHRCESPVAASSEYTALPRPRFGVGVQLLQRTTQTHAPPHPPACSALLLSPSTPLDLSVLTLLLLMVLP